MKNSDDLRRGEAEPAVTRAEFDRLAEAVGRLAEKVAALAARPDPKGQISDLAAILASVAAQVPGAHQIEARLARFRATLE